MSGWMVESWYEKRKRMAMREKGQYWNYVVVLNLEIRKFAGWNRGEGNTVGGCNGFRRRIDMSFE